LLFSLLPSLDRLLYLDCDMIINRDICELYDTDMGKAQIAAVPDWIMTRTLTGPTPTADPDVLDLRKYHHETLGLTDDDIARYFNAGVLLFNFAAMADPRAIGKTLMRQALTGRYMFRDQDILNVAFKGALHVLDARWNVFNSDDSQFGRVPRRLWEQARAARKDPWIIHFADRAFKPWGPRAVPLGDMYWQAAVRTPFFHVASPLRKPAATPRSQRRIVAFGHAIALRFPILRRPLLWAYHIARSAT
jgi:lipopolysaccharide biosynthesis glycosyltransferase